MKRFFEKWEIPLFWVLCAVGAVVVYFSISFASSLDVSFKTEETTTASAETTEQTTLHKDKYPDQTKEHITYPNITLIEPAIDIPLTAEQTEQAADERNLLPLPNIDTSVKFCTDYRCYNIEGTPHNRLQKACYTDNNGFRRFGNDYVIGLGSFYTVTIGDRYRVKLDTGNEFTFIVGDGKADCDTDITNMYTPCKNYDGEDVGNLLEFIVDIKQIAEGAYKLGDMQYYDFMRGSVVELEFLGHDESEDWISYE